MFENHLGCVPGSYPVGEAAPLLSRSGHWVHGKAATSASCLRQVGCKQRRSFNILATLPLHIFAIHLLFAHYHPRQICNTTGFLKKRHPVKSLFSRKGECRVKSLSRLPTTSTLQQKLIAYDSMRNKDGALIVPETD